MRPIPRPARSPNVAAARAVLTHGPGETVEATGGEAIILDVQ